MDEITNRIHNLRSKTTFATQGISEQDIVNEQVRGEELMKELTFIRVNI